VPSRVTVLPVVVRVDDAEVARRERRERMEGRVTVVGKTVCMVEETVLCWAD